MSKEQIEEMAKIIARRSKAFRNPNVAFMTTATKTAESLYNAGYRKQSEGEWIASDIPCEKYVCSVCGGACWYYDYQGDVSKSRYCPNCGAKMKGGAE